MSNKEKMVFVFSIKVVDNQGRTRLLQVSCFGLKEDLAAKRIFIGFIKNNKNDFVEDLKCICKMNLEEYNEAGLDEIIGKVS